MILRIAVYLTLSFSAAVSVAAEETQFLSLFSPNTLAGWQHSAQPAAGWTMSQRTLHGTHESTPLLSGWTFGNFELRFECSVATAGEWVIGFPSVPRGPAMAVHISEFKIDARPLKNSKFNASPLPTTGNKRREILIRRQGPGFTVSADDQEVLRGDISSTDRFGLSLRLIQGTGDITNLRVREFAGADEPAGASMFNGQDLSGWWTPGNKNAWGVKAGHLALLGGGGNYLRSEKEYGNFTLSLEYKIRKRGNSGIGIRTAKSGWPSSDGMELQIEDGRKLDASATMAIYRNIEPIALAEKTEDWNHAVIKADGRMISAWLNGTLVQQVNTYFLPELQHRPLRGWIGFQDHGAPIEFRRLHIIEAPDGLGLDAWYSARTEPASRFVLDRLMNPARLANADEARSASLHVAVEPGGEQVLADLQGPGAMVRLSRTPHTGRLAFYFDGETTPRIQCPADQLHQHVPLVCGDANPVLTHLGYAQRLKITLRDAALPGKDARSIDYRIDYVTLPPTVAVESFRDKTASIARGMLPALDYRHFQISHGTYRDNDSLPRARSGNKSLKPGERRAFVSLDGQGMVRWFKLQAEPKLLVHEDLWLEFTVDGESQPALAAPARYLFPGLEGGKGYHNFLVLSKGGLMNVLPMPFAAGLQITAINRGNSELKNIGVEVCYEPLDSVPPFRLRGVFSPSDAVSSAKELSFSGRGRWLGLVCQTPENPPPITVLIDGQSSPAWQNSSWSNVLGLSPGQFETRCLSGQSPTLSWCFHLLAPLDFQRSFRLQSAEAQLVSRLGLFYAE